MGCICAWLCIRVATFIDRHLCIAHCAYCALPICTSCCNNVPGGFGARRQSWCMACIRVAVPIRALCPHCSFCPFAHLCMPAYMPTCAHLCCLQVDVFLLCCHCNSRSCFPSRPRIARNYWRLSPPISSLSPRRSTRPRAFCTMRSSRCLAKAPQPRGARAHGRHPNGLQASARAANATCACCSFLPSMSSSASIARRHSTPASRPWSIAPGADLRFLSLTPSYATTTTTLPNVQQSPLMTCLLPASTCAANATNPRRAICVPVGPPMASARPTSRSVSRARSTDGMSLPVGAGVGAR